MSIKEEAHLHDYIAVGLLGFAVGAVVAGTVGVYVSQYAYNSRYGEAIALSFLAGVFGYLPGGFIAGYLNYRIHRTEGRLMEGILASIVSLIAHFVISLPLVGTLAVIGPNAALDMGLWGLAFLFAFIFYPIGGLISGLLESRPIPMPAILWFQGAAKAPLPPPPSGAETCSTCGQPLSYIEQYQRWYCYKCKKYA